MIEFEFRKEFRKETNLYGKFINHSRKISGNIIVKNLLFRGLGFDSIDNSKLKIGDKIVVTFELDNHDRTIISKKAIVRKT